MKGDVGRLRYAIAGCLLAGGRAAWLDLGSGRPGVGRGGNQKSMQRPFFSQSPYRVGSRPSRPLTSDVPGDAGTVVGGVAATGGCVAAGDPSVSCSPKMS